LHIEDQELVLKKTSFHSIERALEEVLKKFKLLYGEQGGCRGA